MRIGLPGPRKEPETLIVAYRPGTAIPRGAGVAALAFPRPARMFVEAEIAAGAKDQVIDDLDAYDRRRGDEATRHGDILPARRRIAGGGVVKKHHAGGAREDRL